MIIMRSCKTCEFNIKRICESHHSENGYKWNIDDLYIERKCWSISSEYSKILFNNLKEDDKIYYNNHAELGIYDLIRKIETDKWK